VLIVDDASAVRDGVSTLLAPESDIEVVGSAEDGLEAVAKAQELRPDVIIMDVQMPRMDGIQATELIKRALPRTGVVMFSVFRDCLEVGMKMGADGCLTKDCDPEDLIAELRRVAARISRGG
jgi:DNA-binding NarL/FixJ family response regulator